MSGRRQVAMFTDGSWEDLPEGGVRPDHFEPKRGSWFAMAKDDIPKLRERMLQAQANPSLAGVSMHGVLDPAKGTVRTQTSGPVRSGVPKELPNSGNQKSKNEEWKRFSWFGAIRKYLSREGGSVTIPFEETGGSKNPRDYPEFIKQVESAKPGDVLPVDIKQSDGKFWNPMGRITERLKGEVTVGPNKDWHFKGYSGVYDEPWDFDPQGPGQRNPMEEAATRLGGYVLHDVLGGKKFQVKIGNREQIDESGNTIKDYLTEINDRELD